jgi:hypothetical protein
VELAARDTCRPGDAADRDRRRRVRGRSVPQLSRAVEPPTVDRATVDNRTRMAFPGRNDRRHRSAGRDRVRRSHEALSLPLALIASTVNVYVVPLVRPVTVCVVAVELNRTGVWAVCPTHGVTTYAVIGTRPPSGACHDTVALLLPATAVPMIGGGSATQPVRLNETTATTTTATTSRSGLTDRAIVSPPIPKACTIPRCQNSRLRRTRY